MNILHIVTTISILAILYLVLKLTRKVHTMERSQKNIDLTDNNMSKKQVYSQSWYDDYDRDSHRYRGSGHSSSATQSSRRGEFTTSCNISSMPGSMICKCPRLVISTTWGLISTPWAIRYSPTP